MAGKDDALQKGPGITEQSGGNRNKREGPPLAGSNKRPRWANPPRKLDDLPEELISQILDGIPHGKKVTSLARTSWALYLTARTPTMQKVKASKVKEMADRINVESPPELRHILFAILVDYVKDPAIPLTGANLIYALTALVSVFDSLSHEHVNDAFNSVLDLVRGIPNEGVRAQGIECLALSLKHLHPPLDNVNETDEEYVGSWKRVIDGYENLFTLATNLRNDTDRGHAAIALAGSPDIPGDVPGNPDRFVKLAGIFANLNDDNLKLQGVRAMVAELSSVEVNEADTQEQDKIAREDAFNGVLEIVKNIQDDKLRAEGIKCLAWALGDLEAPCVNIDENDEEYLDRWKEVSEGYENLFTLATNLRDDTARAYAAIALINSLSILDVASGNPGRFVKVAGIFANLSDDKLKLNGLYAMMSGFSYIEIEEPDTQEQDRIAREDALNSVLNVVSSIQDDKIRDSALAAIATKELANALNLTLHFSQPSQAPEPT